MVVTVLEAQIAQERVAALTAAYEEAAQASVPPGLVRSVLLRDSTDAMRWRIETTWASRDALTAMRSAGTPRGVQIFRVAGAEPTLTIFDVVAELPPLGGAVSSR
jgi:heme-degrading monooxygenase HmoA